jgi:hypothetical protein
MRRVPLTTVLYTYTQKIQKHEWYQLIDDYTSYPSRRQR